MVAYCTLRLALPGFGAGPTALAGQRRIWAIASKEERGCPPFDGLSHFGRKVIDLQIEFDGNRGETCLSEEMKQRRRRSGALIPSARKGVWILAHGTVSKIGNPQQIPRHNRALRKRRRQASLGNCAQPRGAPYQTIPPRERTPFAIWALT